MSVGSVQVEVHEWGWNSHAGGLVAAVREIQCTLNVTLDLGWTMPTFQEQAQWHQSIIVLKIGRMIGD